jgi:hypothetical protein
VISTQHKLYIHAFKNSFFFWQYWGLELKVLCLVYKYHFRHSPSPFCFNCFSDLPILLHFIYYKCFPPHSCFFVETGEVHINFCLTCPHIVILPNLCISISWDYKCEPPHPAFKKFFWQEILKCLFYNCVIFKMQDHEVR